MFQGCESIDEMVEALQLQQEELLRLQKLGWELAQPVFKNTAHLVKDLGDG